MGRIEIALVAQKKVEKKLDRLSLLNNNLFA